MKADDLVSFDNGHNEDFTEFEYLKATVNELRNILSTHTDIMRSNNLVEKTETIAPYLDEDSVFEALAGN